MYLDKIIKHKIHVLKAQMKKPSPNPDIQKTSKNKKELME